MGLGFGVLKYMSDTFRYNREILGKKKSARELYKDEIKSRTGAGKNADLEEVRLRVSEHLKRNKQQETLKRIAIPIILVTLTAALAWFFSSFQFTRKVKVYPKVNKLFITSTYAVTPEMDCKTEYFKSGPKAADTFMKGNLKHQNSESYYESGEQFRSALYYYDTLITEVYLFKTGDTIKNFPRVNMDVVQRITLTDHKRNKNISFDFFDGKIIGGTYRETLRE